MGERPRKHGDVLTIKIPNSGKYAVQGSQRPVDDSKPKSDYTMAVIELASVDEAIDAVANLHNSWPKKFGAMKKDRFDHERGLIFSLAGVKQPKNKSKV